MKRDGQTIIFDSVLEQLQDIDSAPRQTGAGSQSETGAGSQSETGADEKWYGTPTYAASVELLHRGWDGFEKMRDLADLIVRGSLQDSYETHYDVAGDECDVPRYLSGEPEDMLTYLPAIHDGRRIVRFGINTSANHDITADQFARHGATAIAAIDAIERTGRRIEVYSLSNITNYMGLTVTIRTCIKAANEPLDVPTLAYCLAHPSWFRRQTLAAMERFYTPSEVQALNVTPGGYYGYPGTISPHEWDLCMPFPAGTYATDKAAAKHAAELILAAIG